MPEQLIHATDLAEGRADLGVASANSSTLGDAPTSILLLEDSKVDAILATHLLGEEMAPPPKIVQAERLSEAIGILKKARFDVVLTDLMLPDSSGLATFRKVLEHARDSAVIVLSGAEDKTIALAAVREGAQDFILKDQLSSGILARHVRFAIERTKRFESHRLVEGILNSLPDHVAVLDAAGEIMAVNAAWREFAAGNQFIGETFGVGSNYLGICDSAEGPCAEESKDVAEGIRSVLRRERREFLIEYPCHSKTEQRWFQVRVHPFQGAGLARVIVSHQNITDRILNAASLQEKNRQLSAAGEVQRQLLPNRPPQMAGYDCAGALIPADETGGDYYDFISIDPHTVAVAVADVSGHGIGAALVMAQLRGVLRAVTAKSSDPGEVLAQINPLLALEASQFVTMFLGRLDTRNHSLTYAAAGHRGFVLRANGDFQHLRSTTPPLGVLDRLDTHAGSTSLEPGDLLIVLTDGLEEATGTTSEPFGIDRVQEIVSANHGEPANHIVEALREELRQYLGRTRQDDDMTVVVIKRDTT